DLDWAHTYYFAISGKDSGAEWSNYYVSPFTFFTDAPPTIPADLSPNGGTVFTTPPLLSFTMTDPDDTIATGLIGRLVLTTPSRPNSGFQYSTTYNVATQRWEYQSTASSFIFNETQRVTIASASAPTGGTYTLTFGPNTTAGIAYNALPAAITSALEALANIGAGNVTVSAVTTRDFYVTFRGALAGVDQAMMSCNAGGLTGGSGHVATVLEDTKGGPAYDTWNWQGYGWDGTLYSGTGVSDTVFSNTASFVWHLGPQVTFTAPLNGDTITGSSITVTWTTTDQQKKRVQLYEAGTTTLVFDSGLITDTLSGYSIPPGMTATGSEYDLVVSVEDSLAVPGSNQITIAVVFAPADTLLNVQVAPITVSSDPVPTAIQVSWDQTTYPATDLGSGAFAWYQVARLVAGDPTWTILYKATSPDDTVFVDYVPPSGLICTYRVTQYISISGTLVSSLPVDADASIDLGQHTILTSVTSPSTWRAVLTHISGKTRTRDRSEIAYRSPNGGQSITITGLDRDQLYSIEANVITDEQASAQDRKITFTDLDAQGVTVCLRDGKTGDATKLFGRILDPVFIDQMGGTTGTWYTLAFGFRSESFQEGQS
ncbi:MAG TPA: Ig-like domain-containing protein, partial [Thermomicrobiales bacterium]|nr:Ig-like domain-containing protein [Thermomicrobiales bacterium]